MLCRQRQNMPAFPVSVPNVVSAWGKARHFLSTGQPLLGEFQANNERANITTTKPGGGAARRGRWLEQRVAGRIVDAGNYDKNHLLGVHLG